MKTIAVFACLLIHLSLQAQPQPNTVDPKLQTLRDRYIQLKTNSETFAEYKVIKEYQLNQLWRVAMDSLQTARTLAAKSKDDIALLLREKEVASQELKLKEEKFAELDYAGSHISFLGFDFGKKSFIGINVIIFGGLLFLTGLMALRTNAMRLSSKEKTETHNLLANEFEAYKHKALEKQAKLSRELQNEKNRWAEMHHKV